MNEQSNLVSWVVFDHSGFPIAFADAHTVPRWELEAEYPDAGAIRTTSDGERSRLLRLHVDGLQPSLLDESEPDGPDGALRELIDRFGFDPVEAALGRIRKQMAGPIAQVGQRDDDQRTSKGKRSADVRRFGADSHSGRLLQVFAEAPEGLTDKEATDVAMWRREAGGDVPPYTIAQWEGCRRRCSDLREAGYIADTGVERDDRIVWAITPQGRDAARRLRTTGWSR